MSRMWCCCIQTTVPFNIFFLAAVLIFGLQGFGEDTDILAEVVHPEEPPTSMSPEPRTLCRVCMVNTFRRVWINRMRIPILLIVS